MSIRHVSPIANTAGVAFIFAIVGMVLSTASANSPTTHAVGPRQTTSIPNARTESAEQVPTSTTVASSVAEAGSCRVIDRPKHTIVYCGCAPDPLSDVASIDAAAILRLLIGNRTCRAPSLARK